MSVNIHWLGTAGIEMRHGGKAILIDPYISRPGKIDILFKQLVVNKDAIRHFLDSIVEKVAAVITGHTHFDHALDIPEIARVLGCTIIGSSSLDTLLSLSGLPGRVTVCRPQENINIDDKSTITMIPSAHGLALSRLLLLKGDIRRGSRPPLRANQYRMGDMFSPKVFFGGITWIHVGSAGYVAQELEGHQCDVLLMCVAGWKKWPAYPEKVIEMLKPSCVIPIHYDDFSIPLPPDRKCRVMHSADLEGFCKRARNIRPNLEVRRIEPFTEVSM